jgi:hypothetical protein
MSSRQRARGDLHAGTLAVIPAAVPAVLGREALTCDPPASGQSIRPPRLEMPEMLTCAEEALAVYGWPTSPGSWLCIPPDPIAHGRVQRVLPPLLVLAVVFVHLAASGKQSTAVQTLKAMVRVPQVRL